MGNCIITKSNRLPILDYSNIVAPGNVTSFTAVNDNYLFYGMWTPGHIPSAKIDGIEIVTYDGISGGYYAAVVVGILYKGQTITSDRAFEAPKFRFIPIK